MFLEKLSFCFILLTTRRYSLQCGRFFMLNHIICFFYYSNTLLGTCRGTCWQYWRPSPRPAAGARPGPPSPRTAAGWAGQGLAGSTASPAHRGHCNCWKLMLTWPLIKKILNIKKTTEDILSRPGQSQGTALLWRLLNMKNGGIFWPDIYMHGECHKVLEKHFENHFWPVHPLGVALRPPLNQKGPPLLKWKLKIIG